MKKLFLFFLILIFFTGKIYTQNFWQQTNGPYGGFINSLGINFNGDIYTSTYAGFYKSTDDGDNWEQINSETNERINTIAFNLYSHIFIGTDSSGIFRSTDNGNTWSSAGLVKNHIYHLATTTNGDIFAGTSAGVFRSTNNGSEWTLTDLNESFSSFACNSNGDLFAGTYSGVFHSTNNGINWVLSLNQTYINDIAINSLGYIFCGTYYGLYHSTDNGETWVQPDTGLNESNISAITINSNDDIFVKSDYMGGIIFRSTDGGANWSQQNSGLTNRDINILLTNSSGDIFAGSFFGGGILRSTNNGNQWTHTRLIQPNVTCLTANQSGDIFAGTLYNGIWRTSNGGNSWEHVTQGIYNLWIKTLAINSFGYIFAGTMGGVYRSTDNGNTWLQINSGLDQCRILSMTIKSNGIIFVGTEGDYVYTSRDHGSHWTKTSDGMTGVFVTAIETDSYENIIASTDGGIFRSTNDGEYWTLANSTFGYFNTLKRLPNGNILAGSVGVYRSIDNGIIWRSTGLSNKGIYAITTNSLNHIFAGTYDGLYRSTEQGDNWELLNSGLMGSGIYSLVTAPNEIIYAGTGQGVFRSAHSTTSNEDQVDPNFNFHLYDNFPNPFNPSTKISWQSPISSWQTLKVYDVLGTEVATLVDEYKPAGNHEIEFSTTGGPASSIKNLPAGRQGIASGVYFYRLQAGSYVETKKMIILK